MQATPGSSPVLSHQSLDHAGGGRATGELHRPPTLIESVDLLKGGKTLGILHNGSIYRLQTTRLGKLILTK
jgi:hemin uptake protein HemP